MLEVNSERLDLPADPTAGRQARAWLRDRLDGWSSDGLDTVELLTSELVTNAVLHTGQEIEMVLHRDGSAITVEVIDRSATRPVLKTYGRDAATGRGLHLVASLAHAWGVRDEDQRKAVWFSVVDNDPRLPGDQSFDVGNLSQWPDLDDAGPGVAVPLAGSEEIVETHILGLPIDLYLAAEQHHDALLREFTLVSQAARLPKGDDHADKVAAMPRRLVELASEIRARFETQTPRLRAQVQAAKIRGETTIDIDMVIPRSGWGAILAIAEQLMEADRFCEQADLLTLATPPEVQRFRRWYTQELGDQMAGKPPAPWPYA